MSKDIQLHMIAHRILIQLDKDEEVKVGEAGIILPDSASKKKLEGYESGVIEDIGATAFDFLTERGIPIPVKKGDHVLIKKHSGVAVSKHGGYSVEETSDYRIVNDEDILSFIEEIE